MMLYPASRDATKYNIQTPLQLPPHPAYGTLAEGLAEQMAGYAFASMSQHATNYAKTPTGKEKKHPESRQMAGDDIVDLLAEQLAELTLHSAKSLYQDR
jgi:hypothetical protein